MGFFEAFGQSIMTVWTVEIWSETTKQSAAMQTLQFAFAFSSLVVPLIARPFLVANNGSDQIGEVYVNATTEGNRNPLFDPNVYEGVRIPLFLISDLLALT